MKNPFTVRNAALAAALAAVAATAWAATELSNSTWIPAPAAEDTSARVMPLEAAAIPRVTTVVTEVPAASEPLSSSEPLPSNEHVPAASEVRERAMAERPVQRTATQPPITIEERHLTLDERIQADIIDRIAQAPNISGKIGVESRDAIVTLSGWTTTAGQARRVVRYAYAVEGVKDVQNEIRPRVGGSI